MTTRKAISKGQRFRIFSRDGFACKYCGRPSDQVILHVDHILPVVQGGENDDENLVTSCVDCNLGKGGKLPAEAAPTEEIRLRLAQERNEQIAAAEAVKMARVARERLRQEVVNFWCGCTSRDSMDFSTLAVMVKYVEEFGPDRVFEWIEKAAVKCGYNDKNMGKYVSGIRRMELADMQEETDPVPF